VGYLAESVFAGRVAKEQNNAQRDYGGAVSLDGFLDGVDGSLDWLHFSRDVQQVTTD
jgi:hypothetical protein